MTCPEHHLLQKYRDYGFQAWKILVKSIKLPSTSSQLKNITFVRVSFRALSNCSFCQSTIDYCNSAILWVKATLPTFLDPLYFTTVAGVEWLEESKIEQKRISVSSIQRSIAIFFPSRVGYDFDIVRGPIGSLGSPFGSFPSMYLCRPQARSSSGIFAAD